MYRQVTMIWLHDPNSLAINTLCERLRMLLGQVEGLSAVTAETDRLKRGDGCHLCVEMLFVDEAHAIAYQAHPARLALLREMAGGILRMASYGQPVDGPAPQRPRLYATAGPACQDRDTLLRMLEAGMDGIRVSLIDADGVPGFLDALYRAAQAHGAMPELLIEQEPGRPAPRLPDPWTTAGLVMTLPSREEDLRALRERLGPDARLCAKVCTRECMDALPLHVRYADEVIIAREALGRSHRRHELPTLQARITALARGARKPCTVASGFLYSMCEHPFPMLSELSDIHNAVRSGVSGLMLGRETSIGRFPIEAVETLARAVGEAVSA